MARLDAVKADQGAPSVIFQRLTDSETLQQIAKAWGLPKGRFVEWFTTQHAELYDTALKVKADNLANDALANVEDATPETVSVRKLQADTKLKVASKWDRSRYGDKQDVNVNVTQWVMRLPTPAANSLEWRESVEKIINPAPTPALAEAAPTAAQAQDAEALI